MSDPPAGLPRPRPNKEMTPEVSETAAPASNAQTENETLKGWVNEIADAHRCRIRHVV